MYYFLGTAFGLSAGFDRLVYLHTRVFRLLSNFREFLESNEGSFITVNQREADDVILPKIHGTETKTGGKGEAGGARPKTVVSSLASSESASMFPVQEFGSRVTGKLSCTNQLKLTF